MKKKSIVALSIILVTALLCACGAAAALTEYDFDTDKIPSVNAIIGAERKVTGVGKGIENGTQYKVYKYESDSMIEDLTTYLEYLTENGWTSTKDCNLNIGIGVAQLAMESADTGKILVLTVTFKIDGYEIRVQKGVGTLALN